MEKHKRIYREPDDETREKMSVAKKGKRKSADHRLHISQSMMKYWEGIPHKPNVSNGGVI